MPNCRLLLMGLVLLLFTAVFGQRESSLTPSVYAAVAGQQIVVHPGGELIVAGAIRQPMALYTDGNEDIFIAWLDDAGNIDRTLRFGSEGTDRLGTIAIDNQGNIIVAGDTTGELPGAEGSGTQFIAKITNNAEILWIRQMHGGLDAYPAVTTVGQHGEIFVAGSIPNGEGTTLVPRSSGFHPYYDAYLQILDEDGHEQSFTQFAVDVTQFPTDVIQLPGGEVVVVGIRAPNVLKDPYGALARGFVARFSGTGTLLDSFELGYEGSGIAQYRAVLHQDDGLLISFGTFNGVGTPDYDEDYSAGFGNRLPSSDAVIGHWSPDGQPHWIRDVGDARGYQARGVIQNSRGDAIVVGYGNGNLGGEHLGLTDAFIIAYSDHGERLWTDRLGTSVFDRAESVATSDEGTIYVTGFLDGWWTDRAPGRRSGQFWFVAAYTPDGEQLWLREYAAEDLAVTTSKQELGDGQS